MNFDTSRSHKSNPITGQVLAEAMPWIKNVTGKTIVIKYGGSAMEDPELRAQVMADIVLLRIIGVNLVIVHGGGKAISAAMEKAQIPVEFKDGLRVTSPEAMEIVRTILVGQVNQELVRAMNQHGNMAVGLSGTDAGTIVATQANPELQRVGRVVRINDALVQDLVVDDYIPVIATVALGDDGGIFNVNADSAAGAIAAAIGAHKIIFLTDVDGLFLDFPNRDTFVSNMTVDEAKELIDTGAISSGMIPKLKSCVDAIEAGVRRAHIVNGTMPHALLLEVLTDKGVGTMITQTSTVENFTAQPLSNFATKLVQNRRLSAGESQ